MATRTSTCRTSFSGMVACPALLLTFAAWANPATVATGGLPGNENAQVEEIFPYQVPPNAAEWSRVASAPSSVRRSEGVINGVKIRGARRAWTTLAANPAAKYDSPDRPVGRNLNDTARPGWE